MDKALWLERLAVEYAGVMAPRRLGIILLCVGAVNEFVGTMLVIQIPAERVHAADQSFPT